MTRGEVLGVISFVSAESGAATGPTTWRLRRSSHVEPGPRSKMRSSTVEVEERAQAARVLETIGDGVDTCGRGRRRAALESAQPRRSPGIRRDAIVGRGLA